MAESQIKRILVTGASGFIGSFVVDKALALGMEVWAAVRPTSSLRYLQDSRIHLITLSLDDADALAEQLTEYGRTHEPWHYVVHAAGATKASGAADFYNVNYEGTKHLCDCLHDLHLTPERFIFVSSLSVFGPVREEVAEPCGEHIYAPILDTDTPSPDTHYGKSKLMAEEYLHHFSDFPYVILRPTGVYGPRETDYFLMAKSITQHIDFAAGYRPQEITFVYVKDLVNAIFLAIERAPLHSSYFITDGEVYSSRTFSDLLQSALGIKHLVRVKSPLWLLRCICVLSEGWAKLTGRLSTLNTDKYHILKQRNWQCDISAARAELGYTPEYSLERGVAETVAWYKKEKWL